MFLLKYWRYIAVVGALLALFAWHKLECSRSYDEGYAKHAQEAKDAAEKIEKEWQAKVDAAEKKALDHLELVEIEVRTVDRIVTKTVIPDCPAAFDPFKRLLNDYIRATQGKSPRVGDEAVPSTDGIRRD